MKKVYFSQKGNTLTCKFKGNDCVRYDFVQAFRTYLIKYIQEREQKYPAYFILFFGEIVKNIYDHADGVGEMVIIEEENHFDFKVRDFGRNGPDMNTPGINYNLGLSLISIIVDLNQDGEKYMQDFNLKKENGYIYSGKIRKNPSNN